MPQGAKKVKIDQRFGKLLKKSEFNTIGKYDKRGKRIDQQDKMMQKYYRMDEDDEKGEDRRDSKHVMNKNSQKKSKGDSESEEEPLDNNTKEQGNKFYDEEGNFQWKPDGDDEESSVEDGSSASEAEGKADDEASAPIGTECRNTVVINVIRCLVSQSISIGMHAP